MWEEDVLMIKHASQRPLTSHPDEPCRDGDVLGIDRQGCV